MMGKKTEKTDPRLFALGRRNLLLIAVAFVVIILGFALMAGAGSTPEHYNPDIFSFRRIVLAPTIAFLGFVFMVFAILYKDPEKILPILCWESRVATILLLPCWYMLQPCAVRWLCCGKK